MIQAHSNFQIYIQNGIEDSLNHMRSICHTQCSTIQYCVRVLVLACHITFKIKELKKEEEKNGNKTKKDEINRSQSFEITYNLFKVNTV